MPILYPSFLEAFRPAKRRRREEPSGEFALSILDGLANDPPVWRAWAVQSLAQWRELPHGLGLYCDRPAVLATRLRERLNVPS